MADIVSPAKRSIMMSGIRSRNTRPEIVIRKLLHRMGYRFRLHRTDLPGRPDIILPRFKTIIFVNGCFWHGHENCPLFRPPKSRVEFWSNKIAGNKARDLVKNLELQELGWRTATVWECSLKGRTALEEHVLEEELNSAICSAGHEYSIRGAPMLKTDLSKTFVQMKLSIVDAERAEKIVPDISRYANSQNKIAAADFFSNHPFHVRMEEISRRIYAPVKDGAFTQSRWFYERARGQFADRRSRLTVTQRKKFDLEHPRAQLFSKTDLAKAEMTWRMRPEIVCLGAQKNFALFAHVIGKQWDKNDKVFSDEWFKDAVGKLIIFRKTERIVSDAAGSWYTGGLRAQTVCYAIAKLIHDVTDMKQSLDLRKLWKDQAPSEPLMTVLDSYAEAMHMHLLSPPAGSSNPSEWAKKKICADAALAMEFDFLDPIADILIDNGEQKSRNREGTKDQRLVDGLKAQADAATFGASNWKALRDWVRSNKIRITPSESGILDVATRVNLKPLSEAQSIKAMAVLERAQEDGFEVETVQ